MVDRGTCCSAAPQWWPEPWHRLGFNDPLRWQRAKFQPTWLSFDMMWPDDRCQDPIRFAWHCWNFGSKALYRMRRSLFANATITFFDFFEKPAYTGISQHGQPIGISQQRYSLRCKLWCTNGWVQLSWNPSRHEWGMLRECSMSTAMPLRFPHLSSWL